MRSFIFLKLEHCAGPNVPVLHHTNINRSPQDLYTVTLTAAMYSGMLFNRCTNARASLVCVVALLIKINVNAAPALTSGRARKSFCGQCFNEAQ